MYTLESFHLDEGYVSPSFINKWDYVKLQCTYKDCLVLFCDGIISSSIGSLSFLESLLFGFDPGRERGTPLLIVANDIEEDVLCQLIFANRTYKCQVCVVVAPMFLASKAPLIEYIASFQEASSWELKHLCDRLKEMTATKIIVAKEVEVTQSSTTILF